MGFRTQEEEGAFDGMTLDEFLIENEGATFIVRARGSAMEAHGILDGDFMIVDKSKTPRLNDIVIVASDGSFRMARADALPRRGIRIEAVVTGLVRKY